MKKAARKARTGPRGDTPLLELGPRFLRYEVRQEPGTRLKPGTDPLRGNWTEADLVHGIFPQVHHVFVDTLAEADGIAFECPKCRGGEHPHGVTCWFEGKVPDDASQGPGRWTPEGTGFADLSFVPGDKQKARSVQLMGGCCWHGHVTRGRVSIL